MKINNDYLFLIQKQISCVFSDLKSGNSAEKSKRIFEDICKKLEKDFLPPIEREDIAALSHVLYELSLTAGKSIPNEKIRHQISLISDAVRELFEKKKSCGELIRRIININSDFRAVNESDSKLNAKISEFLKKLNEAYYKNL